MTTVTTLISEGILVYRSGRGDAHEFRGGSSWLGGMPMLGDEKWPRAADSRPMFHVATIDCATVNGLIDSESLAGLKSLFSSKSKRPLLPEYGSLVFFLDASEGQTDGGAVVFVEKPGPSTQPKDMDKKAISGDLPDEDSVEFPRWPISMKALSPIKPPKLADQHEIIKAIRHARIEDVQNLAGPTRHFSRGNFEEVLPREGLWFWDSVFRFVVALDATPGSLECRMERSQKKIKRYREKLVALTERHPDYARTLKILILGEEDRLQRLPELWAEFERFANKVEAKLEGRNRYERMSSGDIEWFKEVLAQVRKPIHHPKAKKGIHYDVFSSGSSRYCYSTNALQNDTFMAMASGPSDVFEKLPLQVREAIENECKLAGRSSWHQIFGSYENIQDENPGGKLLLLQLASDPGVGFMFGDAGKLAFWISEHDLSECRFDRCVVTVAGH